MAHTFRTDPYIIAEVGSCHDGSETLAALLIESVAKCGADAVKFQVYNAERLSQRRNAGAYKANYAHYELPHGWLPRLRRQAREFKLDLVLSVYDRQDLEIALPYADVLKISSFESADMKLIEACHATGAALIVSTGLTTERELLDLRLFTTMLGNVSLLHCVSAYPTGIKELNLSTIARYHLDGLSDHSRSTLTGALAVCQGARILEVHAKAYSTKADSPDAPHSLDPGQLFEYIRNAQQAKLSMGNPRTAIMTCEQPCAAFKVRA